MVSKMKSFLSCKHENVDEYDWCHDCLGNYKLPIEERIYDLEKMILGRFPLKSEAKLKRLEEMVCKLNDMEYLG